MTPFLLSIWCVGREFIDTVDYIRLLSLSIHSRFQGLHWLCLCPWFVDELWLNIFDNSMGQPCLYFCYRFDVSFVNSLMLSIPYVSCHSIFIDDFKVYQWLCFRRWFVDEPWLSVFDNSLRQPCLYFCYRYNTSIVNSLTLSVPYISCQSVFIDDFKVYRDVVFVDDLWISSDIVFLIIPCIIHDYFYYRFDASVVNLLTLSIPYVCYHSVLSDDFNV